MDTVDTAPAVAPALSDEQRGWYDRVTEHITPDLLREIVVAMTGIPSPTGQERALAEYLAGRGRAAGLEGICQPMDEHQANAVLRRRGTGDGPDLLLYAPIDTHNSGRESEDLPWTGPALRADMVPQATVDGDYVYGLGANNPKGHAACVVAAAEAVALAGVPLRGTLLAGLGAGGMPTNRRPTAPGTRQDVGHGRGCAFLLERGYRGDFAVIAKTGWSVAWEEVGLAWFRIRVHGAMSYTGVRHFVRYDNPIVHAAKVIEGLEQWLSAYPARHTSGLVAPQGSIGAIEGGWPFKPTFSPAACDLYVDLRLSPRTGVADAQRELTAAVAAIAAAHDLTVSVDMLLAVPGTHTDPDSWIVRSSVRAWAEIEGRPHEPRRNQSGATDANILRGHGIPTARIGMARVPDDAPMPDDFSKGMNVVDVRDMVRLTRHLAYVVVDTCQRSRGEVGLAPKD